MSKEAADDSLQIYITRRGKVVLRRPPHSVPTPAQELCRAEFAEAVRSAQGLKMDDRLPPAAMAVQRRLRGFRAPGKRPKETGRRRVLRAWLEGKGYDEDETEVLLDLLAD